MGDDRFIIFIFKVRSGNDDSKAEAFGEV